MREEGWVELLIHRLNEVIDENLCAEAGYRLPYSFEIKSYNNDEIHESKSTPYQTDILIKEKLENEIWIPRVIIEAKIHTVTTHDAITYSQKALTHKNVHPYLRYGILLGDVASIPGRLIRHGHYFDFMLSWKDLRHSEMEWEKLIATLKSEVTASQDLENLLYNTRNKEKLIINILHRKLEWENINLS